MYILNLTDIKCLLSASTNNYTRAADFPRPIFRPIYARVIHTYTYTSLVSPCTTFHSILVPI